MAFTLYICLSEGMTLNTEIDETKTVYDLPEKVYRYMNIHMQYYKLCRTISVTSALFMYVICQRCGHNLEHISKFELCSRILSVTSSFEISKHTWNFFKNNST